MTEPTLSLVIREYPHVMPLLSSEVKPAGVTLEYQRFADWNVFNRMLREQAFDVSELSFSLHIQSISLGVSKVQAIPIFPARHFKHSSIFVSAASGISRPGQLVGRRVGLFQYKMSTALWARSILQHQYGIDLASIEWVTSHPETFDRPPPGIRITLREGANLDTLLLNGELEGLIHPTMPPSFGVGRGPIRRLFPDFRRAEAEYFRQTGIFPVGHVVAVKRSLLAEYPWLAGSLFRAFDEARRLSYERARGNPDLSPLIWSQDYYAEERAILGDDPLLYGLEPSRRSIEAELQFLAEQGLLARVPSINELFAT